MAASKFTPVIVGVGDVKNRSQTVQNAIDPMRLMLQAILSAINDTSLTISKIRELQSSIDSIDVVALWTWPYDDLPGIISKELGIKPSHLRYSEHGGHQPVKLIDEAARRIAQGESSVAIVTGGEALASLNACRSANIMPPHDWTLPYDKSRVSSPVNLGQFGGKLGTAHSINLPCHIYALYENGYRAHREQSIHQNNMESARMYSDFAKVAEKNEHSWSHGQKAPKASEIADVGPKNRMVSFPYPLLMNAFNTVNLAASCLLTSTKIAKAFGIPKSRWIYPLGGAGCQDADNFWERPNFYTSPSISRSLDAGLQVAGLTREQIDLFDFYSCFPIVPKFACHHLNLPVIAPPRPITLLGGLTFFGGAGNNYSLHSLNAMVRCLREGKGSNGLILANGGVLTYQHVLCLSSQPREEGFEYPKENPLPKYVRDLPIPSIIIEADGQSIIETYTVEFDRQGLPAKGFIIGRLTSNRNLRFVANAGNAQTLEQLASQAKEPVGRIGKVKADGKGRNLFSFELVASL